MKTKELIKELKDNGGFNNWRNWNTAELTTWILSNYNVSNYVAKQVALHFTVNN
jgi:hypothetical protein